MATDFLEKLADLDVPPPPPKFDQELHERLNRSLLTQQMIEFVVHAVPWALLHFSSAVLGLIVFTISGKYSQKPRKPPQEM